MSRYYILDGQTPIPCDNVLEWGEWFGQKGRAACRTR